MPDFNRFDICEAHLALEQDWHNGGWLQERPTNQRKRRSTDVQLHRMGFAPGAAWNGFESLNENGRAIYNELQLRYGLFTNPQDARKGELTLKDVTVRYLETSPTANLRHSDSAARVYSLQGVLYQCVLQGEKWRIVDTAYEADLKRQIARELHDRN